MNLTAHATQPRPERVGAAAMSGFAFLWALTGAYALGRVAAGIVITVAAAATAAALWAARRYWLAASATAVDTLPNDWLRRFNRIGGIQVLWASAAGGSPRRR